MKVTKDKVENCQATLTIEMEPAEVEQYMETSYRTLVKRTRIPGFRSGKAPRAIVERFVGRESLLDEAIHEMAPEVYEKALKEQGIEAFAKPEIEVTKTDPVTFKATVPLKPEVELGDYRGIRIAAPAPDEVKEEQVDAVIEELRHRHASWEPVDRPVLDHDLIVLDIWSNVDGKPFINQKGVQYQVLTGVSFPAPGFPEQLVGLEKNIDKEFKLQFPTDYPRPELAGKEASFRVRVTEIKQEVLPELNDDFARQINADFEKMDALRERIRADLKQQTEEKSRAIHEEQVIDETVNRSKVQFPPVMLGVETDRILNQRFRRGQQELDEYLKGIKKSEEELRKELEPVATKNINRSLVLGRVAEEEKIEVSEAEIDTEIERMKQVTTQNKEEVEKILSTHEARESVQQRLLARKIIQWLVEIAGGEAKTETKEEAK